MIRSFVSVFILCVIGRTNADWEAVAVITPAKENGASGKVYFHQANNANEVHVQIDISGLTPGKHGFHIHDKGDMSNGCISMAGHYNPEGKNHGAPTDTDRHVGDLGNINANEHGIVQYTMVDSMISLYGHHSIIGRGVVIHADEDDLGKGNATDSLTTGHAGARVGCGVVGIKSTGNSANKMYSLNFWILFAVLVPSFVQLL